MNTEFRISRELWRRIQADLSRKHPIAAERVGFIACSSATLPGQGLLLLAQSYFPVADENYLDDYRAGATINSTAIRHMLEFAYGHDVSVFHIHRHEHTGKPSFSRIDLSESRKFVPDFFKVKPNRSHGAIVLSHDNATGLCWASGNTAPELIDKFTIVGKAPRSYAEVEQ